MIRDVYYGWWVVTACFMISFYVGGIIFFSLTAFFEPIQAEFGWSYTQISFATSLRGLEMGILAPFVGFLVDRFGSRSLLLTGSIAIGFGLLLLSFTNSLAMFYASFLLIAFGAGGCTSVVTMTAVANWFHKNVGMALGIMASGFGAGGLIVPLVVKLIALYDWRITLIILGFGMWALGIPLSLVVRDRPEPHPGPSDGLLNKPTPSALGGDTKEVEISFREGIRQRAFITLNVVEAIRLMVVTAVVIHVMPHLSNLGIPRATSGMVAASLPLVSIIGRFGFGWLGDRLDKRHVLAATFLLMAMGVVIFPYAEVGVLMVVFVILFSNGFGGSMVLRGSILREYFGRGSFGKLLGILMGSASLGGIVGPTLAGWVFDKRETYTDVWLGLSFLCMITISLILKMKPSRSS
jgi:MFS family permease